MCVLCFDQIPEKDETTAAKVDKSKWIHGWGEDAFVAFRKRTKTSVPEFAIENMVKDT